MTSTQIYGRFLAGGEATSMMSPATGMCETERLRFPVVDVAVEAECDDEATEREEAVAAEAERDKGLWPFDGSRQD